MLEKPWNTHVVPVFLESFQIESGIRPQEEEEESSYRRVFGIFTAANNPPTFPGSRFKMIMIGYDVVAVHE